MHWQHWQHCCRLDCQLRMTKRKSNIFTVAESVTNWFEASNHNPISTKENEEVVSRPGSSRAPVARTAINRWAADPLEVISDSEPRVVVGKGCVNWAEANAGSTVRSEVGTGTTTWPVANNQSAVGIEGVVDCWEDSKAEGGTGDGAELGSPGGVADLTSTPSAEVAEGDTRTPAAFWRLLKDAGYEDW